VRRIEPAPAGFDLAAMRRAGHGVLDDVEQGSDRRLAGFSTVPGLSWLVIIERPYADVIGPLDAALAAEIFALIVLAGAGVLITFAGARRLDRLDVERDAALAEQRSIALRLQRSLLPEVPAPPAVEVHADYTPAAGTMSVGGDWYDVVDLPDGRVALSMGDVAGHGLGAAAAMGQLRSAARMLALGRHEPADAIERLDDFAQRMDGRPLATVIYAILEPATGRLRYACAGHPPPLLIRADGATEFLRDGRSPLLGVDPLEPREIGAVTLRPGDTLVCYTDGLIERPDRSLDDGLNAMATTAAAAASDPGMLAQRLLEQVQEPRRDDAAVLCIRLAAHAEVELEPQPSSVPS
jgi:serine phosphatase RsbU (regulator of sigma subunit)